MATRIMEQIRARLPEGKTPKEIIAIGYKPGSVRKARRAPPLASGTRQSSHAAPHLQAITAVRRDDNSDGRAVIVYQPSETAPEVEQDPDIVALKKELRKSQLERQLREVRAPLDIEARVAVVETEIKVLKGLILDDGGNCLVDTLYGTLEEVEGRLSNTPLVGLKEKFACNGCGSHGLLAVAVRCTNCGKEALWGWHPKG